MWFLIYKPILNSFARCYNSVVFKAFCYSCDPLKRIIQPCNSWHIPCIKWPKVWSCWTELRLIVFSTFLPETNDLKGKFKLQMEGKKNPKFSILEAEAQSWQRTWQWTWNSKKYSHKILRIISSWLKILVIFIT